MKAGLVKRIVSIGTLALTIGLFPANSYTGSKYVIKNEESTMNLSSIKTNPLYEKFYDLHRSFSKPRDFVKNIDGLVDIASKAYNGTEEEFSNFIFASIIDDFLHYGEFYLDWDKDLLREYPGGSMPCGFIGFTEDNSLRVSQTENEICVAHPLVDKNNNLVYEDVIVLTLAHKDIQDVSKIRWYKNINYEELEQYSRLSEIRKMHQKDWLESYKDSFIERREPVFEDEEAIIQLGELAKKKINKRF